MELQKKVETENLRNLIEMLDIDIYGVADMHLLQRIETGIPTDFEKFISIFPYAIVLGVQYGKLGK